MWAISQFIRCLLWVCSILMTWTRMMGCLWNVCNLSECECSQFPVVIIVVVICLFVRSSRRLYSFLRLIYNIFCFCLFCCESFWLKRCKHLLVLPYHPWLGRVVGPFVLSYWRITTTNPREFYLRNIEQYHCFEKKNGVSIENTPFLRKITWSIQGNNNKNKWKRQNCTSNGLHSKL